MKIIAVSLLSGKIFVLSILVSGTPVDTGLYIENVLLLTIFCLILVSLFFFLMTLYKKVYRIIETKQKKVYEVKIDQLLFDLLFNERNVNEIVEDPLFSENKNNKLFRQLTIKALVGLHHNYSGIYSLKLEEFFATSGLAEYSLQKLNSNNWAHIVEGIRDLSSLNYSRAYPRIVSYKNHKNNFVQTEVLLGMIKLKGISELLKFRNSIVYFNDWVQSNILYIVKKHRIPPPENLAGLLTSKNESIIILAIRLMNYYGLPEFNSELSRLHDLTGNVAIKKEIIINRNNKKHLI